MIRVSAPVQGLSVGQGYVGDIGEQGTSLASRLREWVSSTYRLQPFAQCYPFWSAYSSLFWLCSVELTKIDGNATMTAFEILAADGPRPSRFKSVKHFTSWLGLHISAKINGGKILSGMSKCSANSMARALKAVAAALCQPVSFEHHYPPYVRHSLARWSKGHNCRCNKLRPLIYMMLTNGWIHILWIIFFAKNATNNFYYAIWKNIHKNWIWIYVSSCNACDEK